MQFEYVVYDVFTDKAFGGNQLAVFPDAASLPEDKLQKIAAEFNFSEVVFICPPQESSHSAQVRIFTPTSEIDFAGHPTIGTAIALSKRGYGAPMVLELGIGPVPCIVQGGEASFTLSNPLQKLSKPDPELVASALGLPLSAIKTDTHPPVQASLGLPFVLAELGSRALLADCKPNIAVIREGAARYPSGLDFAVFAYVRNDQTLASRMFAPLDNILEDPATGSASATLAALLTELLEAPQNLSFTQGEDMGRPSYIKISTTVDPVTITVSGRAVQIMKGQLIL